MWENKFRLKRIVLTYCRFNWTFIQSWIIAIANFFFWKNSHTQLLSSLNWKYIVNVFDISTVCNGIKQRIEVLSVQVNQASENGINLVWFNICVFFFSRMKAMCLSDCHPSLLNLLDEFRSWTPAVYFTTNISANNKQTRAPASMALNIVCLLVHSHFLFNSSGWSLVSTRSKITTRNT